MRWRVEATDAADYAETLPYSTFLGGSMSDDAWGVAVDDAGSVYVCDNLNARVRAWWVMVAVIAMDMAVGDLFGSGGAHVGDGAVGGFVDVDAEDQTASMGRTVAFQRRRTRGRRRGDRSPPGRPR